MVKSLPSLDGGNNFKNDATYVLNSYSTSLAANCTIKTDQDVIFSVDYLGKLISQ